MSELISALLMLAGAGFVLIATIGLHRFDDVFSRMHAAGKAATMGFGLLVTGSAVRLADPGATALLAVAGVLALITIPAGVHVIARAAFRAGTEFGPDVDVDEQSRRVIEGRR